MTAGQETPLQMGFDGEEKDTRTRKQKKADKQRRGPQQVEMFNPRDLAQFGVTARPQLDGVNRKGQPIGMQLQIQDPRTQEEVEADTQREAEEQTYSFIPDGQGDGVASENRWTFPSGLTFTLEDFPEEDNQTVTLFNDMKLLMWTTRDEAYDRSLDDKRRGYRTVPVGRVQMEVWSDSQAGRYLVTYSDMEMIENIEMVK